MKYHYTHWQHPQAFWQYAVARPTTAMYSPGFYEYLGQAYEAAMWMRLYDIKGEAREVLGRFYYPNTEEFWQAVSHHNGVLRPLPGVFPDFVLKTGPEMSIHDTNLSILITNALWHWPALETNPLIMSEGRDSFCSAAYHEDLQCCAYHRRMRTLLFEQLGREYVLNQYYLSPDIAPYRITTHRSWEKELVQAIATQGSPELHAAINLPALQKLWPA